MWEINYSGSSKKRQLIVIDFGHGDWMSRKRLLEAAGLIDVASSSQG